MNNPWKITTIGLVVAGVTAATSGLTTAYFLRAGAPAVSAEADHAPATLIGTRSMVSTGGQEVRRPPIVQVARAATVRPMTVATPTPAVMTPVAQPAAEPITATTPVAWPPARTPDVTAPVATAPRPPPVTTPTVASASTAAAPSDCATGGDRAMRIAKPGAIGTLVGAGVGAVGGAIADGGKGAGKGALWGGLAGAALGTGYGAYKTKQECGTIFGGQSAAAPATTVPATTAPADRVVVGGAATPVNGVESPFAARSESRAGEGITIYNAK